MAAIALQCTPFAAVRRLTHAETGILPIQLTVKARPPATLTIKDHGHNGFELSILLGTKEPGYQNIITNAPPANCLLPPPQLPLFPVVAR